MDAFSTKLITITAITTACTLLLAVYSLFRRGYSFIRLRKRGWIFKVVMMLSLVLMFIFALYSTTSGPYYWAMYAIVTPLSTANNTLLAFYMASAGARALRAKNGKALLLLITGFIVLLYQAPLTGAFFPQLTPVAQYINNTLVVAVARMFLISATVGAIVFGMRVLMGKETTVLGLTKEESA